MKTEGIPTEQPFPKSRGHACTLIEMVGPLVSHSLTCSSKPIRNSSTICHHRQLFSTTPRVGPVKAGVVRFTCQIEGRRSQWLPGGCAEEGWLICWNSQIKTNKKIYHHIGVEFLLFKSCISWRLFPPAAAQTVSVSGSS